MPTQCFLCKEYFDRWQDHSDVCTSRTLPNSSNSNVVQIEAKTKSRFEPQAWKDSDTARIIEESAWQHCDNTARVIETKAEGNNVRRRRECVVCKERFTTYEMRVERV